jgi:hypothetical protein
VMPRVHPSRYRDLIAAAKRRILRDELIAHNGNWTHAAAALGIDGNYLQVEAARLNAVGQVDLIAFARSLREAAPRPPRKKAVDNETPDPVDSSSTPS